VTVLVIVFVFCPWAARKCHADEPQLDWRPAVVGASILFVPIPFTGNGLPWGTGIELAGFSYAGTDIGMRVLPKGWKWLSPIIVGVLDTAYRVGENSDLAYRKLACDLTGVFARVSIDVLNF
jgi:hypothetical protein